jgi:NADH dehydrogenase
MAARPSVLIIGATGMLGRPVARRLVSEGFTVRLLVRDLARAQLVLPAQCQFLRGDLRFQSTLLRALEGIDAIYLSLSSPHSPRQWDAELEGTRRVVLAAQRMNVPRVVRLSAHGVPEAVNAWWSARRKADADRVVMESGLAWTIFRPTWFCESLARFLLGSIYLRPSTPDAPLHWIAGDDYARQVATALTTSKAVGKTYIIQGPEPVPFAKAQQRFRAALGRRLLSIPVPAPAMRAVGAVSPATRYLSKQLEMSFRHTTSFAAQEAWADLGKPTMRIEDYVRQMAEVTKLPQ